MNEQEVLKAFYDVAIAASETRKVDDQISIVRNVIKEYFEFLTRYEKLDEYTNKEENYVAFLCNRKQCVNCSSECKHTTHIEHAMNFEKQGKIWFEKEPKTAILRESIHHAHFSKYQGTEKKRNALKIKALKRF